MNTDSIEQCFYKAFDFLTGLGYDRVNVLRDQGYDLGILLSNSSLNQKFSFAYYRKNSLSTISNSESRLFLRLTKEQSHIDLSRLLKKDARFSEFCSHQYFISPKGNFEESLLNQIGAVMQSEYINLFNGESWIEISYDPRDDY